MLQAMNPKKGNVRFQRRIPAGIVEEVDRYIDTLLGRSEVALVGRETVPANDPGTKKGLIACMEMAPPANPPTVKIQPKPPLNRRDPTVNFFLK